MGLMTELCAGPSCKFFHTKLRKPVCAQRLCHVAKAKTFPKLLNSIAFFYLNGIVPNSESSHRPECAQSMQKDRYMSFNFCFNFCLVFSFDPTAF